jgi:hypothetical protein
MIVGACPHFDCVVGYGCFTYVPLLWFEDSKTVTYDNFQRLYKHYYNRPG